MLSTIRGRALVKECFEASPREMVKPDDAHARRRIVAKETLSHLGQALAFVVFET